MLKIFTVFATIFSILVTTHKVAAQNYGVYNNYIVNPYLYNPAEVVTESSTLYLVHRMQWLGIEGAPTLSTVSYNSMINESYTGYGGKISSFKRGILQTTDVVLTYGRGFPFNDEKNVLFLGLSAGAVSNSIDLTKIDDADLSDPALANYLSNNLQPAASFGMLYRTSSGINFSFTLPQLFEPAYNADASFSGTELTPLNNAIVSLYYKKKIEGGKVVNKRVRGVRRRVKAGDHYAPLELYATYRYSSFGTSQAEGILKLNVSENFWIAGGYRQNYGLLGNVGISLDRVSLSYSYEPNSQPEDGFSTGTHEFMLGLRIGKQKTFKRSAPTLQSTMQRVPDEKHIARFNQTSEDPDNINHPENAKKKKYYVVIKGFADFASADAYKEKLIQDKYNAAIFYHDKSKKFFVYVFSTLKSSEAYQEARNLKNFTKLRTATVVEVEGEKE